MKAYSRKNVPRDIMSMTQLSHAWDCSTQLIKSFMEDGMPYKKLNIGYEFSLKECEEWWASGYFDSLPTESQNQILKKMEGVKC